jgi:hypothetical protein
MVDVVDYAPESADRNALALAQGPFWEMFAPFFDAQCGPARCSQRPGAYLYHNTHMSTAVSVASTTSHTSKGDIKPGTPAFSFGGKGVSRDPNRESLKTVRQSVIMLLPLEYLTKSFRIFQTGWRKPWARAV